MLQTQTVEYTTSYRGTTNIVTLSLLFSVKNRKFIKGYIKGTRVSGTIHYRIFPGKYLELSYFYWTKEDPPHRITIELIEVSDKTKTLKMTKILFYNPEFITVERFGPIISDFFSDRPRYHNARPSASTFEKVYSESDVQQLLKLLETPLYVEGEEND